MSMTKFLRFCVRGLAIGGCAAIFAAAADLASGAGGQSTAADCYASNFDDQFTGKTLRFDYFHSGTATEEHISLDELRLESDWPGSRTNLVDNAKLGYYLFEVTDPASDRLLYS